MDTTATPIKPGLASDTTKSAKNLVKTVAKQIAQEPFEILKRAGSQVVGSEQLRTSENIPQQQENANTFEQNQELLNQRDKARSQRLMQALAAELDEIKKKKEQEKAVKKQEEEMQKRQGENVASPLVEPAVKKGRRLFNFGKKTQMQRQQTQTERPIPPSG